MRIEEITKKSLGNITKSDLYNLRFRCVQLYQKHFSGNMKQKAGDLERKDFYKQYNLVIQEMKNRNLISNVSALDRAIFKREMLGIDVKALGDLEIIKDYIAIGGTFVDNPRESKEVDVIILKSEEDRDEELELRIEQLLKREIGKEVQFIYDPEGSDGSYIPIFDLILKTRAETIRIEKKKKPVKKTIDVSKKLTAAQRLECDLETEKIKQNKKKAKFPHKLKAAKYTHPNGHPRCILCGQEERTGGICKIEKIEKKDLGDYEYLIHHIEIDDAGKEEIHHCFLYDHIGNLFKQSHLAIDKGKIYLDGKEIKEGVYHIISGLEPDQEVVWSDKEAKENNIKPKAMKAGMTLKEKAKEW